MYIIMLYTLNYQSFCTLQAYSKNIYLQFYTFIKNKHE